MIKLLQKNMGTGQFIFDYKETNAISFIKVMKKKRKPNGVNNMFEKMFNPNISSKNTKERKKIVVFIDFNKRPIFTPRQTR